MSVINTISSRSSQARKNNFANETPQQRAKHREIALEEQRKRRKKGKRLAAKDYRRIVELEKVFFDRYGPMLPDDDAGAHDAWIMAHHLAHRDRPEQRIRAWLRRWAPWYTEGGTDWLIAKVMRKPLKWTADKLAELIGLDMATRTRLDIWAIGATDCKKAKRERLRRERNNATKRAARAAAGAKPHAMSAARRKPWKELGMSKATYYRRRLHETAETNSGTAYPKDIVVGAKQSHGAPPPLKGGSEARAVVDVIESVFMTTRGITRVAITVGIASSM